VRVIKVSLLGDYEGLMAWMEKMANPDILEYPVSKVFRDF
jgi:hypothetical protein